MRPVFIASDNIISPLGFSSAENYNNVRAGKSGISLVEDPSLVSFPLYAGWIPSLAKQQIRNRFQCPDDYTWFEKLAITSVQAALNDVKMDPASERVIFILSTTKGNIELVEQGRRADPRIELTSAAKTIAGYFKNENMPLVVSNACISGVTAILVAKRLLESGRYDHAVVVGADVLTNFVISGFQSLLAISHEPCKPFDASRNGISLGEAAATVVLSSDNSLYTSDKITIVGGSISNDSNHISGPSRTGAELAMAIENTLKESHTDRGEIDFISAHGTGTLYNDEMEAKALNIAGLQNAPVNSLKGYFGHTLGAAGILESIITMHGMIHNELIPTKGFSSRGVTLPLSIIHELGIAPVSHCMKTASGFGGCNAAIELKKA